ncbi:MAG: hypothetical protein AAGD32_09080 [Planctomycetota bacterium]
MKKHTKNWIATVTGITAGFALLIGLQAGCNGDDATETTTTATSGDAPVFTLAWSEYPSWSVFGVAEENGFINGAEGEMGSAELAHNVDIVLKQLDYDPCLQQYGAGQLDAVCITNIDVLGIALSVPSVAVLPTSTSVGADAVIVNESVSDIAALNLTDTYGLERSVSEYMFRRVLEVRGENPDDFSFKNRDPAIAAAALQSGDDEINAIAVWNPFVLQTLKNTPGTKRLFDSSEIPGEIIDMVVMSKASLERDGGDRAVAAIAEAFYGVADLLEGDKRDDTLVALGARFSDLDAGEMAECLEQTQIFMTPDSAKAFFGDAKLTQTMDFVEQFAKDRGLIEEGDPSVEVVSDLDGVKASSADLIFLNQ